jgi:hypothetical protein
VNDVNVLTSPVQPLANAIQQLPDVDVNASATVLGVTKSTDGSTSLTPAVVGASVDVKATLVKNPSLEVGDAEVGLSRGNSGTDGTDPNLFVLIRELTSWRVLAGGHLLRPGAPLLALFEKWAAARPKPKGVRSYAVCPNVVSSSRPALRHLL